MNEFDVAHIRQQGIDLIVVPLDRNYGFKSSLEQADIQEALQLHATAAGLAGVGCWLRPHGLPCARGLAPILSQY